MTILELQKLLNLPETGDWTEFDEAAWKNHSLKTGLDYKPLPITKEEIPVEVPEMEIDESHGLISTDLSEAIKPKINQYNLKSGQYFKGPTKKEYLFLHFTAGWENPYRVVDDWNSDTRGAIGTQFVIGGRNCQTLEDKYDGEIVQCMKTENYAWHLGVGNSALHRNSIGIEICNFGPLNRVLNDYYSWANKRVNSSEIVDLKKDFRGKRYFHKITNEQLHSLNFLIGKISKETGIDCTKGLKERLKKVDPFKAFDYDPVIQSGNLKGLFCHTNVSGLNKYGGYDKTDWWPCPELIDLINSL